MHARKTKLSSLVATAAITGFVLVGCSSAPAGAGPAAADLTPLTFQLNSPGGGYNSGYALALENGYYEEAGLNVTIEPGNGSSTTAQLVAAGQVDIAFADAAAVMKLVAEGADITIIGTILQGNPNEVTSLEGSGINEVSDLAGKTVALPNGYSQTAMFPLLLAANDLVESDMDVVNMPPESMVASLLQGQVDAILGSMDNFSVQLLNEGAKTINLPFIDNGAPTVAQSIIASNTFLEENAEVATAFVTASLKGWVDAIEKPQAALDALKALFPEVNMNLAPGQLDATIYLMCANRAEFVGKATPQQWEDTVKILSAIGILPADISATEYYSYDYLPDEAELRSC
ncbi:ABC transporter substrate-binding protein [Cryobacterium sp. N19]|uniref:ABC transporter substrate-binding protein n=1 Tax=Cryobacterium sp. N19 TaxID=2048288 RepID=UPI0013048502|nr:ABC transporter substrate-binding protein [Cryobacterium sp. N19]